MKILLAALLALTLSASAFGADGSFVAGKFQAKDGALLLSANGNYVEPYFATKALLVAQDGGLDVHDTARAWISWMLPRQEKDGRFSRYCVKNDEWVRCGEADADDSMLAMWIALLYREMGPEGMPIEWQQSVDKAQHSLSKLRNGRIGVYHVSSKNHSYLFMDNVEVYSALVDISHGFQRIHNDEAASARQKEADELAQAIHNAFWDENTHRYKPQLGRTRPAFYPDVVGQTYPWLSGMPTGQDQQAAWSEWKQKFSDAWLGKKYDQQPWGLVALTALKLDDQTTAACWRDHEMSRPAEAPWNILEEAVMQVINTRIPFQSSSTACAQMGAGQ